MSFADARRDQLSGHYTVGGSSGPENQFTPIFAEDVPALLDAHPDSSLILDTKSAHVDIVQRFVQVMAGRPDLLDRLMPHVAGQADLDQYRVLYPIRNYVLALYRTQAFNQFDDNAVVEFVRRNRTPAVMMWHRTRNWSLSLADNMAAKRRYTSSFADRLEAAGAVVYVHSVADTHEVARFASLGIGVYSNGPFPPFASEPAPVEPHIEGVPLV